MEEEMRASTKNGTWELAKSPVGKEVVYVSGPSLLNTSFKAEWQDLKHGLLQNDSP